MPTATDYSQAIQNLRITEPFYLGKYEVTQQQWEAVMGQAETQIGSSQPGKADVRQAF